MSILGNTIPVSIACPALLGGNDEMIRKYKDKYEVSVPDGRYANGRVKYKREIIKTEQEALSRERELIEELKRLNAKLSSQEKPENPKILFKEVAKKWLKHKKFEVSPKTWDRYDSILNNHILPVFGKKYVHAITEDEIRDYFLENENSSTTLRQHHTILKNIFMLEKIDVMKNIKRPRKNNTEINCIKDPVELANFVASFKNSILLPVYIAAANRNEVKLNCWFKVGRYKFEKIAYNRQPQPALEKGK